MTTPDRVRAYTVDPAASRAATNAAHRAALIAMRDRLEMISVEIDDHPDLPPQVSSTIAALVPPQRRRLLPRKHAPAHLSTDLWPRDDTEFEAAVTLAPYAELMLGMAHEPNIPFSTYDAGADAHFQLTSDEARTALAFLTAHGVDPKVLVAQPNHTLGS